MFNEVVNQGMVRNWVNGGQDWKAVNVGQMLAELLLQLLQPNGDSSTTAEAKDLLRTISR